MSKYEDKVAVITGAASGIGKGLAMHCASLGMKLALADINSQQLASLKDELAAKNVSVITSAFDVVDEEAFAAFAKQTIDTYNSVDMLFNNAGVNVPGVVWELSAADWKWTIDINVIGAANCLRVFVPFMISQDKECSIINTASIAGLLPDSHSHVYSISKFAMVGIAETLNFQLQENGTKVKAFLLCPGYISTDLSNSHAKRALQYQENSDYQNTTDFIERQTRLVKHLETGMSVEECVSRTFAGIENDEFYIFTHPEYLPFIEKRAANITKGKRPRPPRI